MILGSQENKVLFVDIMKESLHDNEKIKMCVLLQRLHNILKIKKRFQKIFGTGSTS